MPPSTPPDHAPESPVVVRGAVRRFGARKALDGLDLELAAGRWTGLLGPNGAGKTTLLRAIAGLLPLDEGEISILGRPHVGTHPDAIGWVPQEVALYSRLSARENLAAFGALHGVRGARLDERIAWALDWTGLAARADERVATFSGGMQRRVNIACAVLHRPPILLLDEPTVGVDPQARERVFAMLGSLCRDGVAVLQSSHAMDDLEDACDTLVILDQGRVVADGPLCSLVADGLGTRQRLTLRLDSAPPAAARLELLDADRYHRHLDDPVRELPQLLETLERAGCSIRELTMGRAGLRDLFLQLTGRELRE